MPPAIIRRAEHALAHGAADPSADRAPDDAADRARDPAAFIGSLLRAAHDALGVTGARRQEQCKRDDSRHEDERESQEGRPHRALSLGFLHFDPLNLSPGLGNLNRRCGQMVAPLWPIREGIGPCSSRSPSVTASLTLLVTSDDALRTYGVRGLLQYQSMVRAIHLASS